MPGQRAAEVEMTATTTSVVAGSNPNESLLDDSSKSTDGIGVQQATVVDAQRRLLEARKEEIRERSERRSADWRIGFAFAAVMFLITALLYVYAHSSTVLIQALLTAVEILATLLGVFIFLYSLPRGGRQDELERFVIDQELDLLTFYNATDELRSERRFKLHQAELNKYYEIARSQSVQIFYVGVAFMIAGYLIIAAAMLLVAINLKDSALSDRIVVATLGAIGAFLSNFVGVIYIRMYSGTSTSLTSFHSRLVGTHHLHYGSYLAAKIIDQHAREQTLSQMAINTSVTANGDRQGDVADQS
jgi:hypothetical protein